MQPGVNWWPSIGHLEAELRVGCTEMGNVSRSGMDVASPASSMLPDAVP
jgi:hypothetical protein